MSITLELIKKNYKLLAVLKQQGEQRTELVQNEIDQRLYIRKIIPYSQPVYGRLQQLDLSQIPHIYYQVEEQDWTYVIEEYMQGENLAQILAEQQCLAPQLVRQVALELCLALSALHGAGILHRDIKPGNIILTSQGRVVLADYGAARLLRQQGEQDTRILGTPGYAPPEQYGYAQTTVASDIYALGMTLKELLGSSYNGKLTPILAKCMAFDPTQRYGSAQEVGQALQRVAGGVSFSRKKLVALALMLACGLGLGGGYYFAMRQEAPSQPGVVEQQTQEQASPTEGPKVDTQTEMDVGAPALPEQNNSSEKQVAAPQEKVAEEQPKVPVKSKSELIVKAQNFTLKPYRSGGLASYAMVALEKKGYDLSRPGVPRIKVDNTTGEKLLQPRCTIYLQDILACGQDYHYKDWQDMDSGTLFLDEKQPGGYARLEVYSEAPVLPNDFLVSNIMGLEGYAITGEHPRGKVVFTSQGKKLAEAEFAFTIEGSDARLKVRAEEFALLPYFNLDMDPALEGLQLKGYAVSQAGHPWVQTFNTTGKKLHQSCFTIYLEDVLACGYDVQTKNLRGNDYGTRYLDEREPHGYAQLEVYDEGSVLVTDTLIIHLLGLKGYAVTGKNLRGRVVYSAQGKKLGEGELVFNNLKEFLD